MSTAVDIIGALFNPTIAQAVNAKIAPETTQNAMEALFKSLGAGLPQPAPVPDTTRGVG